MKQEIDKVNKISDLVQLFEIAGDCAWSPEARLFAGLQLATEQRQARPDIDRGDVVVRTAGLASLTWVDPFRYCSLFDDHERAVLHEEPLADDEE